MLRNRFDDALDSYAASSVQETGMRDACVAQIVKAFLPACVLLEGPVSHRTSPPDHLAFCVVVQDRPSARMRWKVADCRVDLLISDTASLLRQLKAAFPYHLVRAYARASYLHGDRKLASRLQELARMAVRVPAPPPSDPLGFRVRTEPFDLLRAFEAVRRKDRTAAGLVLAQLVSVSVEAYFAMNRIWACEPEGVADAIRSRDPRAAEFLDRVVAATVSSLCRDMRPLEDLVAALAGQQRFDREFPA
jgi:hypothetical protein